MSFFRVERKDLKILAVALVGLLLWTRFAVGLFDWLPLSPLTGFLLFFVVFSFFYGLIGGVLGKLRLFLGFLALYWALDIESPPFCALWTTNSLPLSQVLGSDCALKYLFVDAWGFSPAVAYGLTYLLVPFLLIVVAVLVLSHGELKKRVLNG